MYTMLQASSEGCRIINESLDKEGYERVYFRFWYIIIANSYLV